MAKKSRKKNTGIRLVKKANKLVESRYKFDIWETRVFLSVLSQINRNDEDFQVYRIWYKDVIKAFGLRSAQSYEFLRDAAKGLMRKVFYVTHYEEGFTRETEYHIIRSVNYLKEGQKNADNQEYIDITIDPEMKPLLLQLGNNYKGTKGEGFTAYDLRNVIKLGAYHVRIYELLKQYQRIGHRRMDVDEIKRMLEITTEYPLFGNFFQKVIKPSVVAINKHTDLNITKLEKIKQGRKVSALYFEFVQKEKEELEILRNGKQMELEIPESTPSSKESKAEDFLFNTYQKVVVQSFGVTPSTFLNLLKDKTAEDLEQAIRVTRRMKAKNEIKKNVAGFFIKALKEGYTDTKEEALKKKTVQSSQLKKLQAQLADLEQEREIKINNRIREVVEERADITIQAINKIKNNVFINSLVSAKEAALGRPLSVEDYRQDAKLRDLVKLNIVELSKERFTDIIKTYNLKVKQLKAKLDQLK